VTLQLYLQFQPRVFQSLNSEPLIFPIFRDIEYSFLIFLNSIFPPAFGKIYRIEFQQSFSHF
ncbi:MAG: hypothetical protein P8L15_05215, partial [Paracoccaceae bacterium]|nr:hypothetical protein [Paracoccaceae bacterium]